MTWPSDRPGRIAARRRLREEALAVAERQALRDGRSLKCQGELADGRVHHAGETGGCLNDGTGCVCECHDPSEVTP